MRAFATATANGQREHTCSRCGHKETEIIPATGSSTECNHDYSIKVTAPTCTERGYTTHTCTKCGDSYMDSYTAALGHSYGEWVVVVSATATTNGPSERTCSQCGDRQTRTIPATGGDIRPVTPSYSFSSSDNDPTYRIEVPSRVTGGTVKLSPTSASEGTRVTITTKPNSGYILEKLPVTNNNGKELTLTDKGDGKYTFTMPKGKVEVKTEFVCKQTAPSTVVFSDVKSSDWFYTAVQYVQQKGLIDLLRN